MARVTFEYTNSRGQTRRVRSIDQVPKKYMHTMVAVGQKEETQSAGRGSGKTTSGTLSYSKFQAPDLPQSLQNLNWTYVVPAVCLVLLFKYKNFFARALVIVVIVLWGFYNFYSWFEDSDYATTGREIERRAAPPPEPEPSVVVPRFDGGG